MSDLFHYILLICLLLLNLLLERQYLQYVLESTTFGVYGNTTLLFFLI